MSFETIEQITGGSAVDTFNVTSSSLASLTINGGDGNDVFNIGSSSSKLTINGGNGNDVFNIGNSSSDLTINGGNGNDVFNIINSSSDLTINGDNGNDVFNIGASSSSTSSLTADGGDGNDAFNIGAGNLDSIAADVLIFGNSGSDTVVLNDQSNSLAVDYRLNALEYLTLHTTLVTSRYTSGASRTFRNVLLNSDVEQLTLNGTTAPNKFAVTPSAFTAITINGNLPTAAGPGVDYLEVNFNDTRGKKLTYGGVQNGNGTWEFNGSGTPVTGVRKPINFTSIEKLNYFALLAVGSDAGATSQPIVKVYDAATGEIQQIGASTEIQAYEANYRNGVRVATGDLNGDGIPEIITAPGLLHSPLVKVFSLLSSADTPVTSFPAYADSFRYGVQVAVGDVNADGKNDIVVVPSRGVSEVRVFQNLTVPGATVAIAAQPPPDIPGISHFLHRRGHGRGCQHPRQRLGRNHRRLRLGNAGNHQCV